MQGVARHGRKPIPSFLPVLLAGRPLARTRVITPRLRVAIVKRYVFQFFSVFSRNFGIFLFSQNSLFSSRKIPKLWEKTEKKTKKQSSLRSSLLSIVLVAIPSTLGSDRRWLDVFFLGGEGGRLVKVLISHIHGACSPRNMFVRSLVRSFVFFLFVLADGGGVEVPSCRALHLGGARVRRRC